MDRLCYSGKHFLSKPIDHVDCDASVDHIKLNYFFRVWELAYVLGISNKCWQFQTIASKTDKLQIFANKCLCPELVLRP